ncbi:angiopoietin-related protein 3 [Salvelinus alpinus]|uniref:angiopoietin-related protein 3 n=1 Tax=Salvelinus sp. IW2-2015 TaxID=2691554 RepID=UPI000CDFE025|nr:angiopoietin-related protein 3 [Salvelinus alpinus]
MKVFCLLFLVGLSVAQAAPRDSSRVYPTMPSQLQPQTQPPAEAKSRFAMLDDVRLLANGLLQLGQSLRDFVHKTKAQINDIFQKLTNFDRSFYQLSVVTSEIKEEEEELKKTTTFLKANNEEIRNLSLEINAKINSILQERSLLQSQVGGLEEKLKGLSESMMPGEQLSEIKSLKDVIEAQERTMTDLLKAVKEQHDQLNQQKTKINTLEEKISIDHFQDATDKAMASDSETPDMFEYLTGNSSGEDTDLPVDCSDLYNRGERNSGVYPIKPNQSEPFNVYCELTSGGSTVIQRREEGSVDFDQTWEKYEKGFGDLEREFWLGLIKIHSLAGQGDSILRIELEDWKEDRRSVEYQFTLEGPQAHYTLHLTHLSGDLPNAMGNHTRFSTKDRDNNNHQDSNCAKTYTGGWWFNACGDTNLNGRYMWLRSKGRSMRRKGIHWKPLGISYSLKTTKISIRHV